MTLFGIDVSHWQAGISWPSIDTTVVEFSIARASIGLSTDPTFAAMRAGAEGDGLVPGAYHYLTPGDGAAQADVFASMTNNGHGLLCALDCESQGLTIGIISDFADRFAVRSSGHPLFIYTGISFWARLGNPSLKTLGPLWLAYYPPGSGYPGDTSPTWNRVVGGVKPTIWQYGPRPVPGGHPVDGDAYRGTRAELEAYTASVQSAPVEDPVGLTITALTPVAGTVTVKGAGHSAIRVSDGAFIPVAAGITKQAAYSGTLAPVAGHPAIKGPVYGVGDAEAVLLATDVTFTAAPAVDCAPLVAAAKAEGKAVGFEDAITQGTAALAALKPSK